MAIMTAAQTAAELQRKKNMGIAPTNSANQTQYNGLTAVQQPSTIQRPSPVQQPLGNTTDGSAAPKSATTTQSPYLSGAQSYGTPNYSGALAPGRTPSPIPTGFTTPKPVNTPPSYVPPTLGSRNNSFDDATLHSGEFPTEIPEPTDYSWITDMVNNELAQQQATITQELARMQQANELSVNQNNTFLQDQMKRLEENRIQAGAEITKFQNRRGGFYSGGVDYQTAHNNEAFAEQEGSITKDIGARNADIWSRNNLLAQQAATNLAALQTQAPARIQQLIAEQMEKDRQAAIDEAGLTGLYNGAPTMDAQKQTFDQNLQSSQQALDETQVIAKLTGFLPNGQPTSDYQQAILKNAWDVIAQIGYVPNELAPVVGVPAGTRTLDAKQIAISQQNANTSSANSSLSQTKFDQDNNANGLQAQVIEQIAQADSPQQALAWLAKNAASITASLGADTLKELQALVPSFFAPDTSAADAKAKSEAAKKIRSEAVDMAAKDYRWKDQNQDKEALIQEYIQILAGQQSAPQYGYSTVTR